jgi:hypothetical protein
MMADLPTATMPAPAAPAAPAASPAPSPAERWNARSVPTAAPPSRAGAISSEDFHRLPAEAQAQYANLPGGEWIERAKLEARPAQDSAAPPASQEAQAADVATAQPSVSPDGKLRVGAYELSSDDIAMLMQTKAAADLKATQVPASADAYEAKVPEGLKLPDGVEFRIDTADPALQDFRALAKKIGLSQSEFSEIVGVYAAKTAASESAFRNAMKAELDKLGANATMRVTALDTWLRGVVGDDVAKAMRAGMFSEKIVRGLETIAQKMTNQGHASFRQDGREPAGQPGRVSEEAYNTMSPAERWDYARGFDQKQFLNGR